MLTRSMYTFFCVLEHNINEIINIPREVSVITYKLHIELASCHFLPLIFLAYSQIAEDITFDLGLICVSDRKKLCI